MMTQKYKKVTVRWKNFLSFCNIMSVFLSADLHLVFHKWADYKTTIWQYDLFRES